MVPPSPKVQVRVQGGPHDGEVWLLNASQVGDLPTVVLPRLTGQQTPADTVIFATPREAQIGEYVDIRVPHPDGLMWTYRICKPNVLTSGPAIYAYYWGRDPFEGAEA